jgi:hypothetical protein
LPDLIFASSCVVRVLLEPCRSLVGASPLLTGWISLLIELLSFRRVFNRFAVLAVFALSTFSSIVSSLSGNPLSSSAIFSRSVSDFCPPTARACGSRKVGLVVDSSGSNKETDPSDLRVAAARDFADRLISSSEATTKSKADRVTVVDFDHSTEVVYPLGDPAGANFSGIGSSGDTYIASGVRAAVSEITSVSQDQTTGTSGLVVFTDGEDSNQAELVTEIQKTGSMGIRVHFAFLDPTGRATQRPKLLSAILGTGGIYGTMSSPQAQKSFVDLVYSQSLTAQDNPNPNGTTGLLPGLTVARFMSSFTPVKFSYQGLAGEKVSFAVKSLSSQILCATI